MASASDPVAALKALAPLLVMALLVTLAGATEVKLLESPGCQKCAATERALRNIMADNSDLQLTSYDVLSEEGRSLVKARKVKDVPSLVIGDEVIGYREYEGDEEKLNNLIAEALASHKKAEANASQGKGDEEGANQSISISEDAADLDLGSMSFYTLSAVLAAGLVAGFNPCLLGILVFLAASVLSSAGRRRDLVLMVLFFSLGIFTMYFLFGLGMQRLLQAEAIAVAFRYGLTVFLLIAGMLHIEDARRLSSGKESLFRTDWTMKYVEAGLSGGRLSSYFLIGALFSLVKAPCVGAVYLAILDLISTQSYLAGSVYLLFYNLGIILPIVFLGAFMALGMSPQQVEAFRKDHRAKIRLATGLALILLAPLIYWQII